MIFISYSFQANSLVKIYKITTEPFELEECFLQALNQEQIIKIQLIGTPLNANTIPLLNDYEDNMNPPTTSNGYVICSNSFRKTWRNLRYFSEINGNGKWLFVLSGVTVPQMEFLLRQAWEKYKMLFLLALLGQRANGKEGRNSLS